MSDAGAEMTVQVPRARQRVRSALVEIAHFSVRAVPARYAFELARWEIRQDIRRHGAVVVNFGVGSMFSDEDEAIRHALSVARQLSAAYLGSDYDLDQRARVAVEAPDGTVTVFFEGRRLPTRAAVEGRAA